MEAYSDGGELIFEMKSLKVLHVIPSVSLVRGGPSQAVIEMVAALRKAGVDARILTTDDNGGNELEVPLSTWTTYRGIPIFFCPRFPSSINVIQEFLFSLPLTSWLWKNIHAYDLVHIHAIFSYPSTVAMAIARAKNIPYLVRPLGQLCEWSLQQSSQRKQIYLKLIERDNLNGCDRIHLTSTQEQLELAKLNLNASSIVIPHGLTIPKVIPDSRYQLREKLGLPTDQPIVVFLSRLHPKKGLEYLIPALAKLKSESFTFVLAGSGDADYETDIRKSLESTGLQARTIMPGFVDGEFKQCLLQGSDIFALTSYSENFGVCVLEAIAAGLPVIVTEGVALSQTVKDYDLGDVVEQNIDEIASAISVRLSAVRLSVDRRQLDMFSQKSRQFIIDNYTWDSIATCLIDTYQMLTCQPAFLRYA